MPSDNSNPEARTPQHLAPRSWLLNASPPGEEPGDSGETADSTAEAGGVVR